MKVLNAHAAHSILRPRISTIVEELWAMALSVDKKLNGTGMIHRGSMTSCPASPRELFHFGLLHNANTLIIAHSHTGDSAAPSKQDIVTTQKLISLGRELEIEVVDHLIIAKSQFYSFANKRTFEFCEFEKD